MAIVAADILWPYSGGATNTSGNASLGGARSTAGFVDDNVLHDLFDAVSATEAQAGDAEYRCHYILNNHASLTLTSAVYWITALSTSPSTEVDVGLDPAGKNGTATTIANEQTAPAGVTFSRATTKGAGLSLGSLLPGEFTAVWIRRTVSAGGAAGPDEFEVAVEGDTAP